MNSPSIHFPFYCGRNHEVLYSFEGFIEGVSTVAIIVMNFSDLITTL
jgi:hypothetical protein